MSAVSELLAANEAYAEAAVSLAGPATRIWAHDYHLMLLARALITSCASSRPIPVCPDPP